ncbi:cap-specific mRNA (nucleoside-2'-O-)-methyltransferase 2 [Rhinoraja longicauda]
MEHCKTNRKRPRGDSVADLSEFSRPVLNDIEKLFNKTFTFRKPHGNEWTLPDVRNVPTGQCQRSKKLESLKESLNQVKNELSDKELEKWHEHTSFTNWSGKVVPHVRRTMNAELCTQAWCKFHEILCTFPLLPVEALRNGELNSVHLCEGPGAFITSLNHYLRSNHIPCDWSWVANTLNPYHEGNDTGMMITDDRLIAGTLPWWYFGPDNTGDIMDQQYLQGLTDFTRNMKSIHLVTADGSVDCQDNPGEQEALVAPLHYCEAISALRLLSPGGSLVLKMFTLFERSSVCLLYLLNCCFHKVHVFKPSTSKAGNSEVYTVCLDYAGQRSLGGHFEQLVQSFGPEVVEEAVMAHVPVPPSFLGQLEDCCHLFHRLQTGTIWENLQLFGTTDSQVASLLAERRDCAASFYLHRFCLRPLSRDAWVLKGPGAVRGLSSRLLAQGRKQHTGSYNERQELARQGWQQRVRRGNLGPDVDVHCQRPLESPCILQGAEGNPELLSWYVLEGRGLSRLASSPFCQSWLLRDLNDALVTCQAAPVAHCPSCCLYTGPEVLMQLAFMKDRLGDRPVTTCPPWECLVIGSLEHYPAPRQSSGLRLRQCQSVPPPPARGTGLHDGDPGYQRWLLGAVLEAVTESTESGALILPLLSCFTRFTAGLVFVLQHCFRAVSFASPTSSDALGHLAVLLCVGFQHPPSQLVEFLRSMQGRLSEWPDSGSEQSRQVLQFVPMELLLNGTLPEFLIAVNLAITKQRLHLALQITT